MQRLANSGHCKPIPRPATVAQAGRAESFNRQPQCARGRAQKTTIQTAISITLLLATSAALSENTGSSLPASHEKVFEIDSGFELSGTSLSNVTLGQQVDDNVQMSDQEVQAGLLYRLNRRTSIFGELKLVAEQENRDYSTPRVSEEGLERGETWLQFESLFDESYSIKLGRQSFFEPRRWWWDDDLDAVSLGYLHDRWRAYVGYGEELGRTSTIEDFIDPENEDVERVLAHVNWRISQNLNLGAFYLRQRDNSRLLPLGSTVDTTREDESDADLEWFGIRASGTISRAQGHGLSYWADAATVNGDEALLGFADAGPGSSRIASITRRDVRGWALDLGLVWTPPWSRAPIVTVSHAYGSGDKDLTDDSNRNFRQTGLQDRDEEFRTYGELLRPELSNLRISTIALTFPVHTKASVTLGYHHFRQVYAAPFLRESRIEAEPTGASTDIGEELSLLAELRKWENLEVDLAAAVFRSGDAFGIRAGKRAKSLFVKIAYEF